MLAVILAAMFLGPGVSKYERIDYCVPFVERAMDRTSPSKAQIADRAIWGTMSGAESVIVGEQAAAVSPATGNAVIPNADYALGYENFTDLVAWIASVNALHSGTDWKPSVWQRIDIASFPELAMSGFDPSWVVDTATAWSSVESFVDNDTSTVCDGVSANCALDLDYGSTSHRVTEYVDALSPLTDERYKGKVFYLPHICGSYPNPPQAPFPTHALMEVNNSGWRAWKMARISAIWDVLQGSASAIHLDWKPSQYMCREGGTPGDREFHAVEQWLGGDRASACSPGGGASSTTFATMQGYCDETDTPWTAEPSSGASWTDYVQGFRAFTDAMQTAGIPYELRMSGFAPWWLSDGGWPGRTADNCGGVGGVACAYFDDPATTSHDENDDVLDIFRGAFRVFIDRNVSNPYDVAAYDEALADLSSNGVDVVEWETGCGSGHLAD